MDDAIINLDALPGSALLPLRQAAAAIGVRPCTLSTWRCRFPEKAPPAVRVGASLRWEVSTLRAWIAARREVAPA